MDDVPRAELPAIGKTIVVLVVEEEAAIRDLLLLGLTANGFTVKLACNGKEAVELFRAMPGKIDVFLIDMGMASMNGPTTLEVLRQEDPKVRCCFMSGGIGVSATGDTPVLAKPFRMESVVNVLQSLVR